MRIPVIAAMLAVGLAVGAAAGLMPRPVPFYETAPARPYAVIGPVHAIAEGREAGATWLATNGAALVQDARTRYGRRPDALVSIAHEPLPNGVGARSRAIAISWSQ